MFRPSEREVFFSKIGEFIRFCRFFIGAMNPPVELEAFVERWNLLHTDYVAITVSTDHDGA